MPHEEFNKGTERTSMKDCHGEICGDMESLVAALLYAFVGAGERTDYVSAATIHKLYATADLRIPSGRDDFHSHMLHKRVCGTRSSMPS
jgi:hypothetical protein